jgi:hypothetical protein
MNVSLTNRVTHSNSFLFEDSVLTPCDSVKFSGVNVDKNLNFNAHIDSIISKCRSRLFLMIKLSTIGLKAEGLKFFYITNIRSVLTYGAPAWYTFLSDRNRRKLESMQKSCISVILPEFSYNKALTALRVPTLNKFLFGICESHLRRSKTIAAMFYTPALFLTL